MTSVPHSGNQCSGMCETPCDHADCWQCEGDYLKRYGPEKTARRKLQLTQNALAARAKSIPPPTKPQSLKPTKVSVSGPPPWSQPSAPGVGANATTVVSRQVLDALTKRAGVQMYWNNGNPVFTEPHDIRPLGDALTWKPQEGTAIDDGASEEDVKAAERLMKNARDPLRLSTSGQFTVAQLNDASNRLGAAAAIGRLDDIMKDIVIQGATLTEKASTLSDMYREWAKTRHPMQVGSGAVDGRATVEK